MAGHFKRKVPGGYMRYRETGSLDGMDPDLRKYYEPLRLIITGPLFNWERLVTIARFNLGHYDAHRDAYIAAEARWKLEKDLQEAAPPPPNG